MSRVSTAALSRLSGPSTRLTVCLNPLRPVTPRVQRSTLAHRSFSASRRRLQAQAQVPPPPPSAPHGDAGTGNSQSRSSFPLFAAVVVVSLFATIYAVVEYYNSLSDWPEPIRSALRSALKMAHRNEPAKADQYYRKAIDAALALPPSALAPDPLKKLSGIYIHYAAFLENNGERAQAFEELRTALDLFGPRALDADVALRNAGSWAGGVQLSDSDHARAIGLSQKMGDLAWSISKQTVVSRFPARSSTASNTSTTPTSKTSTLATEQRRRPESGSVSVLGRPGPDASLGETGTGVGTEPRSWPEAAEHYLSTALSAMLRTGLSARPADSTDQVILGRDLDLPGGSGPVSVSSDADVGGGGDGSVVGDGDGDGPGGWAVTKGSVAMTMVRLSEVYTAKGENALAGQLLIQAVSILLPPKSEVLPPVRDRCEAAVLMTAISDLALKPNTAQAKRSSKSWSLRSLQIADQALGVSATSALSTMAAESTSSSTTTGTTMGTTTASPSTRRSSATAVSPVSGTNEELAAVQLAVAEAVARDPSLAICLQARITSLFNLGVLAEMDDDLPHAAQLLSTASSAAKDAGFARARRQAADALRRVRSKLPSDVSA